MLDIAVAVFVAMMLGYAWYSPLLFGDIWCSLANPGMRQPDFRYSQSVCLGVTAVSHVVTMSALQSMIGAYIGVLTVGSAFQLGLFLAAISAALAVSHTMFGGKPLGMYAIDVGYDAAVLVLGNCILAAL